MQRSVPMPHAYAALWLNIVNTRSNLPSQLAEAIRHIDMTKWPAPVIRLFLGQTTPEAVSAAADDPNAKTKQGKVCEANFYTAELALQRRAKDEATRLFRLAATDWRKGFTERAAAHAELKALDATP
jgi:lipoprotein NlpI